MRILVMPESQPRNLRVAREIARRDVLFSVARVPESQRLIVASSDGKVHEIDAATTSPPEKTLAEHGRYVTCVRLSGNTVVSGGYDGRLIWWDLQAGRVLRTTDDAHGRWVRQLAVSPDGTKLASVGDDMACRIWDIASGNRLLEMRGHAEQTPQNFTSMLYCCAYSNDGRYLATGDRVGHVVIWEAATGRKAAELDAPTLYTWDGTQRIRSIGGVRALAFSPDGQQLAVGGVGQIGNVDALQGPSRVEIYEWQRGQRVAEFTGQNGIVNRLLWHPQNQWLCALGGGGNGLFLFYDPVRRTMIHQGNVPMHVHDAACNEDFTAIYAVGHQKAALLELKA
jgi:WD40 repeat protein